MTDDREQVGAESKPSGLGAMSVDELREMLPALARVALPAALRTLRQVADVSAEAGKEVFRAVRDGGSPTDAVSRATMQLRDRGLIALGLLEDPEVGGRPGPASGSSRTRRPATADELRARGARLLYESADVWREDDTHPAYERILEEMSPDEARILRLLVTEGPQPSIDIRTNRPLGVGSELVASGLSMIGVQAGVRYVERTKADLNNLERLGLVWFSREQVSDPTRYQVVEVQPDVLEAMQAAGRSPKTIHRSIHLTPFGEDFCKLCLPVDTPGAPT